MEITHYSISFFIVKFRLQCHRLEHSTKKRSDLSSREIENFNTEKDYYNDLPGKLPPELLDPVEDIPPQRYSQPPRRLTIQVKAF